MDTFTTKTKQETEGPVSKYIKKPVVIDAIQWHGFNRVPVIDDVHAYDSYRINSVCKICGTEISAHGFIDTLEGGHIVCPEDWIITGVKGERYPCKPDIFAETYDRVDN